MAGSSWRVVPVEPGHVDHVAAHMRQTDVDEVRSASGLEPLPALQRSVAVSAYVRTVLLEGQPVAIGGAAPHHGAGIGVPWLLGTDAFTARPRVAVEIGRAEVRRMLELYPTLHNFVAVGNAPSIRWLGWLGFRIHEPIPYGVEGKYFHPFLLRAEDFPHV